MREWDDPNHPFTPNPVDRLCLCGLERWRHAVTNAVSDDYEPIPCECELDWCCPQHSDLPTPEDRLATYWSQDHP